MNQRALLDIVFHPQGYTLREIQDMVRKGTLDKGQLAAIFDADLARILPDIQSGEPLSSSRDIILTEDFNHIVFWGTAQSGKTAVIGSLLSLKRFKALQTKKEPADERTLQLQALFRNTVTPQPMPTDLTPKPVELHPALFRKNWLGKTYPIVLTEARLGTPLEQVVEKESEQVHVVCIDCRQDLAMQQEQIERLIGNLETNGYLEHTNGIYLLVTKTDLMQAPRHYQENAAQTLVTSNMPSLWHKIQNICYDKQIYNTLPIAYSCGDFLLKDLALLNSKDNECVMREALLPKCHARRTLIGRLLSKGKRFHAVLATFLVMMALGYLGYKAFEAIQSPPTAPVKPFDYRQYFMKEEKAILGATMADGQALYNRLSEDLAAEHSLHTASGNLVLSQSDYEACETRLTNDFAKLVVQEASYVFNKQDWSQDEGRLRTLRSQMKELMEHPSLTSEDLPSYSQYIDDYFDELKPLLKKSQSCNSMDEVNEVLSNYAQWKGYPYNNDTLLNDRIKKVPLDAYESLARSYERRAVNKANELSERLSWFKDNPYTQTLEQYINKIRMRFDDETSELRDSIDELIGELEGSDEYREVIEKLQNTRRRLDGGR